MQFVVHYNPGEKILISSQCNFVLPSFSVSTRFSIAIHRSFLSFKSNSNNGV